MSSKTKITIIGGGVGGYPAAIKAARLGAEVTLIEKDQLGGVCLNRGCIPTKSLLQSGEVIRTIKEAGRFGIQCGDYSIDFGAVMSRKNMVVQQLCQGVEKLLLAKKIRIVKGTAELLDPSTIQILESNEKIKSDKIIIATGSKPRKLTLDGLDAPGILDSDTFLDIGHLPKSAVIVGGGYIGVEFAQILHHIGVDVTILEILDSLVAGSDKEIAAALEQSIRGQGIKVFTKVKVKKASGVKSKKKVTFEEAGKEKTIQTDMVIVSVGRSPDLSNLKVDRLGLANKNNFLVVNDRMETNVPGIYAAGDVTGGIMLAHVATAEGECAARNAMGHNDRMSYKAIPACIYTSPEVSSVGMTEEKAREKFDVQVARFPFHGCGKALVLDQTFGMVKIVSEKKYGEVLGVHIIGPHATDMIAEAVLGISMEMSVDELARAVHPHPTLSETLMEAAMSLTGGAIHLP